MLLSKTVKKTMKVKKKIKMKNYLLTNQKMEVKQLLLRMEIQINNKITNRIQIFAIINLNILLLINKWVQDRINFSQGNLNQFKTNHFPINKFLECISLRIIFQINNQDFLIPNYLILEVKLIKINEKQFKFFI